MTAPRVSATEYTVSLLPDDHIDWSACAIHVEYRGGGTWRVRRHSQVLGRDGMWRVESRDDHEIPEWMAVHRFTEAEAIRLAVTAAPHVRCGRVSAAEIAGATS